MSYSKKRVREAVLKLRRALSDDKKELYSNELATKLFKLSQYKNLKTVGLYSSKDEEPNTERIIDRALSDGKKVALPKISGDTISYRLIDTREELVKGEFGVLAPKDSAKIVGMDSIDLILAPGVAFDQNGARIGFGGGYFDRALIGYKGYIVALAFPCQIVDEIKTDPWDVPMSQIIVATD